MIKPNILGYAAATSIAAASPSFAFSNCEPGLEQALGIIDMATEMEPHWIHPSRNIPMYRGVVDTPELGEMIVVYRPVPNNTHSPVHDLTIRRHEVFVQGKTDILEFMDREKYATIIEGCRFLETDSAFYTVERVPFLNMVERAMRNTGITPY